MSISYVAAIVGGAITAAPTDRINAPPREVLGWCSRTLAGSSFDKFEGDHFFLFNNAKAADSIRTHLFSFLTQHP